MPAHVHRRILFAFTLALPVSAGACNSELQAHAEVFLDALDHDDYPKFQAIAGTELAAEIGEGSFHDIAATYDALGPQKDRTRNGTGIENGTRYVSYMLEHEQGDVQLRVISNGEKLDGFKLEGGAWKQAWTNRHLQALQSLLAAARAGDRAAADELVHPSIDGASIDGLLRNLQPLGEPRTPEISDETIPEFRVRYDGADFIVAVRLSGPKITRWSIRPAQPS